MDAEAERTNIPASLASGRIAGLSDTMFGVAMTLVVTTLLPSVHGLKGPIAGVLRGMTGERRRLTSRS